MTTLPSKIYRSKQQFKKEKQKIFFNLPILMMHTKYIEANNNIIFINYFTHSLIFTINQKLQTHIFFNICTHRGAQLDIVHSNKNSCLECPYHGWKFNLEGNLLSIPKKQHFPSIDKNQYKLKMVNNVTDSGFVFMNQNKSKLLASYQSWLAEVKINSYYFYKSYTICEKVNWKLIVDTALEQYHFDSTHKKTINKYIKFSDILIEEKPPHLKITFKINSTKKNNTIILYFFFPSCFILFMNGIYSVMSIFPQKVNKTILLISHFIPHRLQGAIHKDKLDKYCHFLKTVLEEDLEMARLVQRNLNYKKNNLTLGEVENNIYYFYKNINYFLS